MKNLLLSILCLSLGLLAKAETSDALDNTLYADAIKAKANESITMSVKMKNTVGIAGFQFDLVLPEGVSVMQDEDGFDLIALSTERTTTRKTDFFSSAMQPNGDIRVMCSSTKSYTFEGNDGEVAVIQLKTSSDITPGDYVIKMKDIVLSDASSATYEISEITTTLTIESNIIPEDPDKPGDGDSIDIDVSTLDNVVYINPVTAKVGEELVIPVNMKNTVGITGFQFDLVLPEGVSVMQDEDGFDLIELSTERTTSKKTDYFNSALQKDGSIRIMCSSTKSYVFSGNDGEVATVKVKVADTLSVGEHPIVLKNIVMSDANSATYEVEQIKSKITITEPYLLGDANEDGTISVADLTVIASYILDNSKIGFNKNAADVNQDGQISVADLTMIASIILGNL